MSSYVNVNLFLTLALENIDEIKNNSKLQTFV